MSIQYPNVQPIGQCDYNINTNIEGNYASEQEA